MEFLKLCRKWDEDGNGLLDREEIRRLILQVMTKLPPSEEVMIAILDDCLKNPGGGQCPAITFSKFYEWWRNSNVGRGVRNDQMLVVESIEERKLKGWT